MALSVVARAKSKPGCENELLQAFQEAVHHTHQEKGCQKYALHQDMGDPSTFIMIEKWDSAADLNQHLQSPHIQTLFAKLPKLIVGEPEILKLNSIAAGGDEKKGSL